jgi:hypothetical protein
LISFGGWAKAKASWIEDWKVEQQFKLRAVRDRMPGRNHCQSVVCTGFAMARNSKVRRVIKDKSVVPGGELNDKRPSETRKLFKARKHGNFDCHRIADFRYGIGTREMLKTGK